jgi:hypothetical protein
MSTRAQEQAAKADKERKLARDWLLNFMEGGVPRFLTKDELRAAAMRELGVSKNSFDYGWIDAIETKGRPDWYDPLPRRRMPKQ